MAEKRNLINIQDTIGSSSQVVLEYNSKRTYLLIQNNDPDNSIYLTFGEDATLANGVRIGPNLAYEPPYEVISQVNIISTGEASPIVVVTNIEAQV